MDYRIKERTGRDRYEAGGSAHDDMVMALCLAI
jgi:hypothetical protein